MSQRNTQTVQKKKKANTLVLVLLLLILIILIMLLVVFLQMMDMNLSAEDLASLDNITQEEIMQEEEIASSDLPVANVDVVPQVTPEVEVIRTPDDYNVTNIILFGMDNRYRRTILGGRSDVNIILSIDHDNNEMRMTSIMRDTLIYLPDHGDYNRINAAIVYEDDGPVGAVEAIEQEFGIEIDNYVVTSFVGMAKIIDSLGGVNIKLSQTNVWDMNGLIQEMNPLFGNSKNYKMLSSSGTQKLTGIQAVAYSRLRHTDGGFARDSKQKEVLSAAKDQLANMSLGEVTSFVNTATDYIKTDMTPLEMVELATKLYPMRNNDYTSIRIPLDDHYKTARYNKMAILEYEKEYTQEKVFDFIYEGK